MNKSMKKPDKIELANLPTPIYSFNKINPDKSFTNLYIKRDDFTGLELSGNKVRKLEYSLKEALDQQAEVFITCGGIQSNHCRATATAAAMLSKKSHLVLRGQESAPDGNYLLDKLLGAEITFITAEEYKTSRASIMENIKEEYAKKNVKAYILPEGASNGIGLFGYYAAYEEILEQEKALGIEFDAICVTDGSGGTYGGLYAANEVYGKGKKMICINIYNKDDDSKGFVSGIINDAAEIAGYTEPINKENMHILVDYVGEGYAIASDQVRDLIKEVARETGVILDPVYTGKTFMGVLEEIKKNNPLFKGNVLYVHTGGLYGLFPQKETFYILP